MSSSDGIAYSSDRNFKAELYLVKPDGSHPTSLMELPEGWLTPVWRPRH